MDIESIEMYVEVKSVDATSSVSLKLFLNAASYFKINR